MYTVTDTNYAARVKLRMNSTPKTGVKMSKNEPHATIATRYTKMNRNHRIPNKTNDGANF